MKNATTYRVEVTNANGDMMVADIDSQRMGGTGTLDAREWAWAVLLVWMRRAEKIATREGQHPGYARVRVGGKEAFYASLGSPNWVETIAKTSKLEKNVAT
jgi:hypothetical protein